MCDREVDVRCLPSSLCIEYFEKGDLSESGDSGLIWLADQLDTGIPLLLLSRHWDYRCVVLCLAFLKWVLRIQTQVVLLAWGIPYCLSHIPCLPQCLKIKIIWSIFSEHQKTKNYKSGNFRNCTNTWK